MQLYMIAWQTNIEVYRVKYDIFSIRIEFLTTNDLDPGIFEKSGH